MCNDVTWKACLEQGHSFKYLACVLNKNGTDDANQNISYARQENRGCCKGDSEHENFEVGVHKIATSERVSPNFSAL